jgi:two-component system alkaline phosphatase synthesis response regulator PhoP
MGKYPTANPEVASACLPVYSYDVNTHEILRTKASASALIRRQANPSNRILLVDDDMNLCWLSADVLARSGYQVHTATDGAAGWEALLANSYDLLITENRLPKISGVELVKKVRAARMTLPVVLASRLIPTEELSRTPSLQLAATLLKPFTSDELLGTVKNVLRVVDSTVAIPRSTSR